jgi:hypothetical protein
VSINSNTRYLLTYVTEEGGLYKTLVLKDEAEYDKILATGEIPILTGRDPEMCDAYDYLSPIFVALSRVKRNYDFISKSPRGELK